MPFSISWIEVHGALTHFPIASLLLVCALDCGAWLSKKASWREASLILLWIAVLTSPPALLSGYLTGREFSHPPVGFESHWIVALATSVLALICLIWRLRSRDHLARHMRTVATLLTLLGAATVSYTGYLGGQMVFGDTSAPESSTPDVPTSANAAGEASGRKLAVAADKMQSAADKLQAATDKLPAPAKMPTAAPAPASGASDIERAADKLERVATTLEGIADKLARLSSNAPAPSAPPSKSQTPAPKSGAKPTGAKPTEAPKIAGTAPVNPVDAARLKLISDGEKLARSEENDCLSCHKFKGEGRNKGPDLTHEASRHDSIDWHIQHLIDPEKMVPGSKMPAYADLKPDELKALATWMASLR